MTTSVDAAVIHMVEAVAGLACDVDWWRNKFFCQLSASTEQVAFRRPFASGRASATSSSIHLASLLNGPVVA